MNKVITFTLVLLTILLLPHDSYAIQIGVPVSATVVSPSLTPSPSPEIVTPPEAITPTPEVITPTPPLHVPLLPPAFFPFRIFLVFGLPLHLAMAQFGANIPLLHTLKFLSILLFPFLGNKKYITHQFTVIEIYDPEKIRLLAYRISDILGQYSLPSLPPKIYLKAFHSKRYFTPVLYLSSYFATSCLYLNLIGRENHLQRLQNFSMNNRIYPLIAGILTASIALYYLPTYPLVIYLYLCLQALFSEYIYPRLEK